jgi:hypothetical protein
MAYQIETFNDGEWTDDVSLLGLGARQDDNVWPSAQDARDAIDQLAMVGFDRDDLRVVEIAQEQANG